MFAKCNRMSAHPVQAANVVGKSCLWYMDPKNGNYNAELMDKIVAATFSCFALQEPLRAAQQLVGKRAHFLPEGFDEAVDTPVRDVVPIHDVSFIGHPRGKRGEFLQAVQAHNYRGAYGTDHAQAVAESRISLNFTEGGTSDRTYKVLAAGGFLLTQPWPEMRSMFTPGKHLDVFENLSDLREQIEYYLKHHGARERIRWNGYNEVQKYSRSNWAQAVLELAR